MEIFENTEKNVYKKMATSKICFSAITARQRRQYFQKAALMFHLHFETKIIWFTYEEDALKN